MSKGKGQQAMEHNWSPLEFQLPDEKDALQTAQTSDMILRIGKIKNYNNKIIESKSYFKLGINEKINLDEEKGKPDVKPKGEGIVKTKPDVKQ